MSLQIKCYKVPYVLRFCVCKTECIRFACASVGLYSVYSEYTGDGPIFAYANVDALSLEDARELWGLDAVHTAIQEQSLSGLHV